MSLLFYFLAYFLLWKKKNKNNEKNFDNEYSDNNNDEQKNNDDNNIIENNTINNNDNIKCEIDDCLICDINKECINCNPGYDLFNKKCIKYSFKAIYKTVFNNENLELINTLPTDIIEMTVDGIREEPSKNYIFPSSGNHTVHILLDITNCKSLNNMFCDINKMVSFTFSQNFNTQNIEKMDITFAGCTSLTSIDFSILNTQNLKNVNGLFHSCHSLVKADFSNLNLKNLEINIKCFIVVLL